MTGSDHADEWVRTAASTRPPTLGLSVGDLLRTLGGAAASIVVALGQGPLRTKHLTATVAGYTPRTIYRYAARLSELGIVERLEEPGVPSKVVHRLTVPAGRALFHLLQSYGFGLDPTSSNRTETGSSLGLVAELWDSGLIAELSREPRSPTEISTGSGSLTFHQINRRAQHLKAGGLLFEEVGTGPSRRYGLTRTARHRCGFIVAIGRWRQRYGALAGTDFTADAMATVLQAGLPLLQLPARRGTSLKLGVAVPARDGHGADGATLVMRVEEDGIMRQEDDVRSRADAWAIATINTWFRVVLDDRRSRMRVGGDLEFLESCLGGLHRSLAGASAPADSVSSSGCAGRSGGCRRC